MTAVVSLAPIPHASEDLPREALLLSEQAFLGCLLFDNAAFYRLDGSLLPWHFYEPFHQRLYAAMGENLQTGKLADAIVMQALFAADPAFKDLGGVRYFADLVDRAPPGANLADYARIIKSAGVSRRREELGLQYAALAKDGADTQEVEREIASLRSPAIEALRLPVVTASSLAGVPVPERAWHVEDMIPGGTVTLLFGDGGTGKSLLAKQLAVSTALGRCWLGYPVEQGRCLFLTAEDDLDEVHRRLVDIAQSLDAPLSALTDLRIISLAGEDALLGVPDGKSNLIKATPLFQAVEAQVKAFKPALVVLDTLADLFGGEENQRAQARQFIGLLRGLAIHCNTTVLLLAHPSLAGMASGSGSSGSTGWNNSVRSRLYFARVKDDQSKEEDPDARVLKTMKANYGRTGAEIHLRWERGVFTTQSRSGQSGGAANNEAQARADRVFLDMLAAYEVEGRNVGSTTSGIFAPNVFAKDDRSQGISKKGLNDAMNRLFAAGRLRTEEFGPPSHKRKKLVIASPREGQ